MKILLVDDDTAIIRSVLAILRTLPGHEIRAATSGAKALENAGAMGGPDLLITDVVMEGMDGFALRDTLLARFPALRVLFITGYDLSDHAAQIGDAPVLQKPFEDQALLAAIETASAPPAVEPVAVHPEPPPAPVPAPLPVAKPVSIPRVRAVAVSEEDITGAKVGPYQVLRKLGQGKWGSVYEALQISMGRNVALKVLSPRLQSDPVARSRFIADASAKARVQHPFILSVYEAGEADGYCFYTHEMVEGRNLAEVQAAGDHIDEPAALQVIRVAAEGLSYLNQHKIPHDPIQSASLYFGSDQRPRLANLATVDSTPQETPQEIRSLAEIALAVLPQGRRASAAFQAMLARMQAQGPAGFASWGALLQEVKTLEPKVIPVDAFKLNAQEQAAIRAVEEARKRQKMQIVWSVVGIVLLIWAVVGAVWWAFFRTNERNLDVQVMIPAGPFIYQEGEKLTLPAFSIDKYEVTFGHYAKFLADLERNPTTQYDHPRQPVGKSHKPDDWDIYLGRARWNKPVTAKEGGGFAPIDLNCPVFKVDYWDAYAYAKWKGRRLPTEQEWEKAARGTQGFLYPWGNRFDPKKCDSRQSGIGHWIAVDANSEDRSPFGVIGMAGNVAEWTDSWDAGHKFPVIRGGSYHSPDCKLTDRVTEADPETAHEFLGFRTVSDVPASKP